MTNSHDPLFSRGRNADGTPHEKLTIATPFSIRVTEQESKEARLQADYRQMNLSDYVRHLIAQDKKVLQREFDALTPLFSGMRNPTTTSASCSELPE